MAATLKDAEEHARDLAYTLKEFMPEGWGFTLMMFTYGEHGETTYISTAKRPDMIKSLREMIEKLESGE